MMAVRVYVCQLCGLLKAKSLWPVLVSVMWISKHSVGVLKTCHPHCALVADLTCV